MDARLQQASDTFAEAKDAFKAVTAEVQAACSHPKVLHSDGYYGELFRHFPLRICLDCRLYQEGGSVHFPPRVGLFRCEFVKEVSRDEIHKHRLKGL